MISVALSPPKRVQRIGVHSQGWFIDIVRFTIRPLLSLKSVFNPPDKLDVFFDSARWGDAFTSDVKNIRFSFLFGIDSEDESPSLFESKEVLNKLRVVWK